MNGPEVTPGTFTTPYRNLEMKPNTKHTMTVIGMVAVVILASTAFAAAPVSAQSDDESVLDSLFSDDEESTDAWETIKAAAAGLVSKYNPLTERPDKASAGEYADRVQERFNSNSGTLTEWANSRSTASADLDVVRLKFTDESGETSYRFIVTSVNSTSGNYTGVSMMNASEFQSTDRQMDTTIRLSPYASRHADGELETFVDEYAEPGDDVTQTYLAGLAGEYRGEVEGDALPGGDD